MITWKLETVPIKNLKEFEKNPRNIKKEQQQHLTTLIEKFSKDDETLIKEFKQLKIPNDAKLQQVPDTTKEREIVYMSGFEQ